MLTTELSSSGNGPYLTHDNNCCFFRNSYMDSQIDYLTNREMVIFLNIEKPHAKYTNVVRNSIFLKPSSLNQMEYSPPQSSAK